MGKGNEVGYGAIIGAAPQDLGYRGEATVVEVGDGNVFREYVTVHRGAREGGVTRIGSGCFLMVGAHVAHDCVVGDGVILVNNVLLGGYVEVGGKAFVGGGAVVHQRVRIGRLAMVQGGAAIGMDVPPFCMAVRVNRVSGLNRVGLRRAGISVEVRRELEVMFGVLYREGLNRAQALEKLAKMDWRSKEARDWMDFVAGTRRGLCRFYWEGDGSGDEMD
jgi:UDP-N-acetylglucosamine acyltransferase